MPNDTDRDQGSIAAATAKVGDVAGQARDAASHAVGVATERAGDLVAAARESAGTAYSATRDKAASAYEVAVDKAFDAYDVASRQISEAFAVARERAGNAGKAANANVQEYPAIAVIGAIAAGAVVAALVPRSAREAALLSPVGARIGDAVRLAVDAAKEAGLDALGEAGINRDAARTQIDKLVDVALGAAKAAGGAAADTVKKSG